MSKGRILVVDDEIYIVHILDFSLGMEGYEVITALDGEQALEKLKTEKPDLIVLDIMMPKLDGYEVCKAIKSSPETRHIPVILLSAKGRNVDQKLGFDVGADDYITKPTDLDELLARIRVVLRRSRPTVDRLQVGRLLIDFRASTASSGPTSVRLTHREFELLRYLAERRDKVVHRDELLREVWGYLDATVTTRSVDQTIARLRKKIEPDPRRPEFIRTVHGDGYCLSAGGAESKN